MAKIRSFKPDFWTDSKLVQIPFEARLMFMGLWTYACDNGHVDDDPLQLKMRVFPADDVDVAHLLEVLAGSALIERKDGVVTVLNLSRHQHINKRYFTSCEHCATTPVKPEQQGTTLHNGGKEKKPVDGECDCECDGDGEKAVAPQPLTTGPKRPTRIPDVFVVTDSMRTWAAKNDFAHLDLDGITDEFVDFWRGATKNATKADWIATWRNRVREVAKREPVKPAAAKATAFWDRRPFEAAAND